ncbi:HNH endonuclease [Listeria monocytogenes]|nr:HNH endonuclease [Listeria monocytogenes]
MIKVEDKYTFNQPKKRVGTRLISKQQAKQEADKRYNNKVRNRYDKDLTKFYQSTAWRKKRAEILKRDGHMCKDCLSELEAGKQPSGTLDRNLHVDHIMPIREDYNRRLDSSNLQVLCQYHHNIKTRREERKR